MKIVRNIQKMQHISQALKRKGRTIGFIPTMGALHEGHLSLIRQARKENEFEVVSIFVNPAQFGPKEDFKRYPRPFKKDIYLCKKEKVNFIFYPRAQNIYPLGYRTYVTVEKLSVVLCGKSRPGHFRGVATVVTKLFNIVQPAIAYFGQKDAQQAVIIKKMVTDLNIPTKIKVMPIVREKDGLALSSRNGYLNQKQRKEALVLSRSLGLAKDLIKKGIRNSNYITNRMRQIIQKKKSARIEYICIIDSDNLKPVKKIYQNCLVALAVRIGKTRLIDNIVIRL